MANIVIFSTVLAYVEGIGDVKRRDASLKLLAILPAEAVVIPAQALGELYRVLIGKARRDTAS